MTSSKLLGIFQHLFVLVPSARTINLAAGNNGSVEMSIRFEIKFFRWAQHGHSRNTQNNELDA